MKILDMGFDKRMEQVMVLTSDDKCVKNAEELLNKYMKKVQQLIDHQSYFYLEDAITQLRTSEADAGYRFGVSDGMQIQQEVNALIIK